MASRSFVTQLSLRSGICRSLWAKAARRRPRIEGRELPAPGAQHLPGLAAAYVDVPLALRDFADVYTKVAMIGRVYEAGVARAWRGEGDPETERATRWQANVAVCARRALQVVRFGASRAIGHNRLMRE